MQYIISEDNQTIQGAVYRGNLYARQIHEDGRPYHTFRTATVLVTGNGVRFEDCLFENTAGPGEKVGQAIALYVDGDGIELVNCVLRGHQDTLFLAPLPPVEYEKDGFLGPGQHTPRTPRTVRFKGCRIEGGVDFIFGGATAYFEDCEFVSVEPGYVFAPSTPQGIEEGFVAVNCKFTAVEGVAPASCYIGRPWREYGRVRLENCYLGAHIHPEGWHDWNKTTARQMVRFEEIGSYGPGADNQRRPEWVYVPGIQ